MQTFIPLSPEINASIPCFSNTTKVLDRMRLGKQRVEGYQILRTILGYSDGWKHHPAVKMWMNYKWFLYFYIKDVCNEWISRGYKDSILNKLNEINMNQNDTSDEILHQKRLYPWWINNKEFNLSHRSNLLRKFPDHYKKFWPNDPDNLPYYWPV